MGRAPGTTQAAQPCTKGFPLAMPAQHQASHREVEPAVQLGQPSPMCSTAVFLWHQNKSCWMPERNQFSTRCCAHVKLGSSLHGTAAAASRGSMQSAHLVNWTASSFIFLHTKETHFQCWESAEFLSLPIAQNKPSKSNVCEYWKGHCWQSKF